MHIYIYMYLYIYIYKIMLLKTVKNTAKSLKTHKEVSVIWFQTKLTPPLSLNYSYTLEINELNPLLKENNTANTSQ